MGNHGAKGGDVVVGCKAIERVEAVGQAEESNGKVDGGRVDWMARQTMALECLRKWDI